MLEIILNFWWFKFFLHWACIFSNMQYCNVDDQYIYINMGIFTVRKSSGYWRAGRIMKKLGWKKQCINYLSHKSKYISNKLIFTEIQIRGSSYNTLSFLSASPYTFFLWPNLKNLSGGLNLSRGLNMVGSTSNCIKCLKI